MPRYRALVSTYKNTEMAIDKITNTIYFDDGGLGTNAGGLATDVANLFATYRALPTGFNRVNCRIYDMAEPTPREIQGEHTATITNFDSGVGPREVALCLSFYSGRNLPRNRGRIYIGPWSQAKMLERPGANTATDPLTSLSTLRQGLQNIGGLDVKWCVYSPSTPGTIADKFKQVSAGWMDDEWDTQRSRGLRAVLRNAWEGEG
jgi:hypothetical protein